MESKKTNKVIGNRTKYISFLFLFFFVTIGFSQKDSLLEVWHNESVPDTSRFKAMDDFIWNYYIFSDPDSALYFADQLIAFSKNKNLLKEEGRALSLKGSCFYLKGNYIEAINFYDKSLIHLKKLNEDITSPLNNLGACYTQIGDYKNAINTFEEVLRISEKNGDLASLAGAQSNLGALYLKQDIYDRALDMFRASLTIRDSINDRRGMSESLSNIGIIYNNLHEYDSAMYYYQWSLKIDSSMNNKHGMVSCYSNLGQAYLGTGDLVQANIYVSKGLELAEEIGDKQGIVNTSNKLSLVNFEQKRYGPAKRYAEKALTTALEINYLPGMTNSYLYLYKTFKELGQYKRALEMYESHISIKDSLKSEEYSRQLFQQEYQHKYEQKTIADSLIQAEKMKLSALELEAAEAKNAQKEIALKAKNNQLVFTIIGLLLVAIFAFFIFKRYKISQKQKNLIDLQRKETQRQKEQIQLQHEQLESSYKEMNDSIVYAKRLQDAILPKRSEISNRFENNFVLFKPKDIVSGDFYWFEHMADTSYIAVADCTGHGVPGAMVSVVCSNALSRSLLEFEKSKPNEILDMSLQIIAETFTRSGVNIRDGMDISLCSISGLNLLYSGAHNPLWIIRNKELIELKADKQAVGASESVRPFKVNTFTLEKDDVIYMFSDGFVDQFGGQKGKKFKTKSLRELLISLHELEMDQQETQLLSAFEDWKGNFDQIDDVCIIGLKI